MNPENLKYTAEHEWVGGTDAAGTVRVGITDFAQDSLGDIVYVHLPEVGDKVAAGAPMGELESTKSVSDLFAPVTGTITACNASLGESPELCNSDPYGEGWIVEIRLAEAAQPDSLMSAADYEATVTSN